MRRSKPEDSTSSQCSRVFASTRCGSSAPAWHGTRFGQPWKRNTMSSPQNDASDAARIIPVIPDAPDPAPSQPGGGRAPIAPDPLNTLKLKPEIVQTLSTIFDPEIPVNIYEL